MILDARPSDVEQQLEQIADVTLARYRLAPPIDIYRLCIRMKLDVRVGPEGLRPTVLGRTIFVAPEDPPERQRFATSHELAHLLLRERGMADTEWNVNWLASALLHPREWFLERLAARRWDLAALREDCPWSSYEAIGRRVVNLERAVLWVCDRGPGARRASRSRSRSVAAALERPTPIERAVVRDAAATLRPQRRDGIGAWPLPRPDRSWLRVVSLARADALAA